jgi:hypothetical protein
MGRAAQVCGQGLELFMVTLEPFRLLLLSFLWLEKVVLEAREVTFPSIP